MYNIVKGEIMKAKSILFTILIVLMTIGFFLLSGFVAVIVPANSTAFYSTQFEKNYTLNYVRAQRFNDYYVYDSIEYNYLRNLTDEELLDLMNHTMRYCMLIEDNLNPTINGTEYKIFNENELSHMADVREVFKGGFILVGIGGVFFALGLALIIIFRKAYCKKRKVPYITLIALFSVLALIGIFGLINFDLAFEVFHMIFFDGNWTFSEGVMIAMIGDIFTGIVPIIIAVWVGLLTVFLASITVYNHFTKKKYLVKNLPTETIE